VTRRTRFLLSALGVALFLPSVAPALPETAPPQRKVLSLLEALAAADENNLDLQAARLRLMAAREGSRQAWAGYLPQVSAGGSYNYNSNEASILLPSPIGIVRDIIIIPDEVPPFNPDFDPDQPISEDNMPGLPTSLIAVPAGMFEVEVQRRHQLGGQVQLRQALFAPMLWPAINAAYVGEEIAELSVENARREILFAVAQIYYGSVGLREAVDLQHRMLEVMTAHERDAELRVQQGIAPRLVLLRAQIERTKAEQDLIRTRNAYESTLSSLATILDMEPGFDVSRPPPPDELGETDLAASALSNRPEVRIASKSVELSEQMRRMVQARYLPMVGLTVTYQASNVRGFSEEYGQWIAGLGLSWNIFDGGLRESELREAGLRLAESRVQERAARARALDEIRRAELALESARSNLLKAEEQALLASENAELVRRAYEAGVATSLEMVDANAALRGAELARINEQLNAELAALALARAAGLFNP
jgi:outer membrane protein, multidrug efflux system